MVARAGAGPLERAVDRCDGGTHHLGRPLVSGQVLQSRDERELDRFASVELILGSSSRVAAECRPRPEPRDFGEREVTDDHLCAGRSKVHRQDTASASAGRIQAGVSRDGVQPATHRAASLETVEAAPGPHEGVLQGVIGVVGGPKHPVAMGVQLPPPWRHQFLERGA